MPTLAAMARAVSSASPVIIITRAPEPRMRRTASGTPSRGGSSMPTRPSNCSRPWLPCATASTRRPSPPMRRDSSSTWSRTFCVMGTGSPPSPEHEPQRCSTVSTRPLTKVTSGPAAAAAAGRTTAWGFACDGGAGGASASALPLGGLGPTKSESFLLDFRRRATAQVATRNAKVRSISVLEYATATAVMNGSRARRSQKYGLTSNVERRLQISVLITSPKFAATYASTSAAAASDVFTMWSVALYTAMVMSVRENSAVGENCGWVAVRAMRLNSLTSPSPSHCSQSNATGSPSTRARQRATMLSRSTVVPGMPMPGGGGLAARYRPRKSSVPASATPRHSRMGKTRASWSKKGVKSPTYAPSSKSDTSSARRMKPCPTRVPIAGSTAPKASRVSCSPSVSITALEMDWHSQPSRGSSKMSVSLPRSRSCSAMDVAKSAAPTIAAAM
mmetsp:Transcript_9623/g.32830  ORF Transcript_9623/g.32830 Transcript_9623/m.32830 type:complete len:447 (-) Transcript_9623:162-1502(-)